MFLERLAQMQVASGRDGTSDIVLEHVGGQCNARRRRTRVIARTLSDIKAQSSEGQNSRSPRPLRRLVAKSELVTPFRVLVTKS